MIVLALKNIGEDKVEPAVQQPFDDQFPTPQALKQRRREDTAVIRTLEKKLAVEKMDEQ